MTASVADSVNIRAMLVPDPGHILFECDYEKADVCTVIWEADDDALKAMFREDPGAFYDKATAHLDMTYKLRKRFIHLTNYGGRARTAAMGCGISIAEAQSEQDAWFRKHPGIRAWHDRTWRALQANPPQITNRFGFRKLYWGAPDDAMLREALAWQPQSHVALCTGAAHIAIDTELSWVEVLLDGHDSIVGQMPIARWDDRDEIRKRMEITVPYEDPLVMVAGIKASDKSWGDCQAYAWK